MLMHLAQVVSFVSLCATRTWKNWKTPSTLITVSYRSLIECAGVDYDYNWGLRHGKYTVRIYWNLLQNLNCRLHSVVT